MTSANLALGIDVGTQSTKVFLYDAKERRVVEQGQAPHDIIQKSDGTSEQEASWWIAALDACLASISPEIRRSVECIGVSGQQHGFVPVDADGNVICNVKLWNDTTTEAECEAITRTFGGQERLLAEVGNPILPGYTAPKVLWLKNHRPEQYEKLAHILLPHDYINFYLTGALSMEWGDASGTGFLNVRTREWHPGVLEAIDSERNLLECLPPFVRPDQPAGKIRPEIAEKYGFSQDVTVSAGGGDNMMGAIGTGCVTEGVFTASLGTSGTLYGYADNPVVDPNGTIAAFCSSTGGWLPLVCTMNCTVATELTRHLLEIPVSEFDQFASTVPAGSDGLVTVPFYNGERTPNLPNARGSLLGISPHNMTKAHLLRSAMEAALFGLRFGLKAFQEQGLNPTQIHLIGGGAKSALWRQMAADIFNCPIACPSVEEAAAFGAALQAWWMRLSSRGAPPSIGELAMKHVKKSGDAVAPDPESAQVYTSVYNEYLDYVALLTPHFTRDK